MAKEYHHCERCNKETVIFASSRAEAKRKLRWFEEKNPVCRDCQYAEAVEADTATTAALELPALIGTEAQVKLATLIRLNRIVHLMRECEVDGEPIELSGFGFSNVYQPKTIAEVRDEVGEGSYQLALSHLCSISDAGWWLEVRDHPIQRLVTDAVAAVNEAVKPENNPALIAAVNIEATIRPTDPVTETIAVFHIDASHTQIGVRFEEKHDNFRDQIKLFGFMWQDLGKRWMLNTNAGQCLAIAAEVGAHLISRGFVVRIINNDVREAVISGRITKSEGRRIDWFGDEKFRIDWRRIDGDFYESARQLKGAAWSKANQTVLVPVASADDVRDFADMYGFKLTDAAINAAYEFDDYRRNGMVASGSKRDKGVATGKQLGRDNVGSIAAGLLDS